MRFKSLILPATILILLLAGCGTASDPVPASYFEYLHSSNITLVGLNPITLEDDALVWIELRPDLDFETVRAQGKPTQVSRGVTHGFSLPIYNNDNEELYLATYIPFRWDEASDIIVHIHCYLDTANVDKRFNIQLSWKNFSDGDIIPATSNDLTTETQTGAVAQYKSYYVHFIIDYDIAPADPVISSDELHLRIRRLAASADEIAGKIVITHVGVTFQRNKLGSPVP